MLVSSVWAPRRAPMWRTVIPGLQHRYAHLTPAGTGSRFVRVCAAALDSELTPLFCNFFVSQLCFSFSLFFKPPFFKGGVGAAFGELKVIRYVSLFELVTWCLKIVFLVFTVILHLSEIKFFARPGSVGSVGGCV